MGSARIPSETLLEAQLVGQPLAKLLVDATGEEFVRGRDSHDDAVAVGMLPIVGVGFGAVESTKAGRELILTIQESKRARDRARAREYAIERVIKESEFYDKSLLFEIVAYLRNVLAAGLVT